MELLSDAGSIDTTSLQVFEDVTSGLTLFEAGDVLFAKITPCMENGKGAFVENLPTRYALGSTEFHVLRPSYAIDAKFLYYYTFNPVFRGYAAENMSGAAGQKRVSSRFLKDTRLFLPSLSEQERIAAYLDMSCTAIDAAVAAKHHQLETLDALRKSIIQRAVTRGISARVALESTGNVWMEQIPYGWKLVCLKRIAEIQGGLTLGKQYEGALIERPYLRVGNVQDGHLDLADVSVIELPASVAEGVELRPDDVLMTEGGDLDKLGRGYLWKGEIPGCLHQNHIFAVRCFLHKLKPMFLAYVTAAKYGRDYFEATGKKTTNLACTNATKVGEFLIPLPELTEQEAICVHLDEKLGELKCIVSGIETQISTLTAYRKSLIHECVTGQRRILEVDLNRVRAHG
jgi:type I restriction enzyme S subunit